MSLVSYSTWGCKESDVTEQLSTHAGDRKDMSSNLIGLVVLYEEEEISFCLCYGGHSEKAATDIPGRQFSPGTELDFPGSKTIRK